MRRRYIIGLTGNIGVGKSTVARMLADLGAQVIDADSLVHELMVPGSPVWQAIVDAFGDHILQADDRIDRARLAAIVFSSPQALSQLEAIIHPAVIREINHRISTSQAVVTVVEAIKLIEAGMHTAYDELWVVTCHPEEQVRRLKAERGMAERAIQLRMANQSPQAEKAAMADVVIDNSGTLAETRRQVSQAWQALMCDDSRISRDRRKA